jgi:hypothetical protein
VKSLGVLCLLAAGAGIYAGITHDAPVTTIGCLILGIVALVALVTTPKNPRDKG